LVFFSLQEAPPYRQRQFSSCSFSFGHFGTDCHFSCWWRQIPAGRPFSWVDSGDIPGLRPPTSLPQEGGSRFVATYLLTTSSLSTGGVWVDTSSSLGPGGHTGLQSSSPRPTSYRSSWVLWEAQVTTMGEGGSGRRTSAYLPLLPPAGGWDSPCSTTAGLTGWQAGLPGGFCLGSVASLRWELVDAGGLPTVTGTTTSTYLLLPFAHLGDICMPPPCTGGSHCRLPLGGHGGTYLDYLDMGERRTWSWSGSSGWAISESTGTDTSASAVTTSSDRGTLGRKPGMVEGW